MKKYIKLFPFLIIFGFLTLFFLPNVKGFDDLDFEFQKDTLYINTNVNNEFDDSFNLRKQSYYDLGNYQASESFIDDDVNITPSGGWINNDGVGCNSTIQNSFVGHNKVLRLYDNGVGICLVYRDIDDELHQTVELYMLTTNISQDHDGIFTLHEVDIGRVIYIRMSKNDLDYYDGSWKAIKTSFLTVNTWYHIKIVMNDTINKFDVYIDGKLEKELAGYERNTIHGIDRIYCHTSASDTGYSIYYDGIGWTNNITAYTDLLDFSNDIVGSKPIGWNSDNTGICTTTIKDTLDDRTNILELYDEGDGGSRADIEKDLSEPAQISIQADWAKTEMTGGGLKCGFYENDVIIVLIGIFDNDLQYYDSGWDVVKNNVITASTFITINIVFNFKTDTFDVYIDNKIVGNNLDFNIEGNSEVDNIRFFTDDIEVSEFYGYIDNIYIDPIYYTSNLNLYPLVITLDTYEVDKYEFALKDVNTFNEYGSGSANNWTEMENGYNHTYIAQDLTMPNNPYVSEPLYPIGSAEDNRVFQVIGNGDTHELTGIEKTDIGIVEGVIDVSFCINATQLDNSEGGMKFYIYTYTTWLNTGIWINWTTGNNGAIYGYGAGGTWTLLNNIATSTLSINDKIELEVHIGSFNHLKVYENDIFVGSYAFPLVDDTKEGLNLIQISSHVANDAGNNNTINIHNVGIYLNGSSICTEEMARVILDTNNGRFDSKRHNNFFINGNGNFLLGIARKTYYVGTPIYQNISAVFLEYDSTLKHLNSYDMPYAIFTNSTIIFHILGGNFSVNYINIEGAKLVQDTNEYPLLFTYGGINIHDNYFYVDSSNNLRFIHTTNQDDILEFIQAEFDIQNRSSDDTAITFRSNIDNNAYGFFRVKFSTTSLIIQIENILNTNRLLLEKDKTIDSFVILITDTNKNSIEGITEGLITAIGLFDIETSMPSVISLNLIDMLIPLIIILLPTLSISKLYGDFLVVPLFFMFSLILAITGLIPIWLFFVILVSCSLFIFFEKDKKVVF